MRRAITRPMLILWLSISLVLTARDSALAGAPTALLQEFFAVVDRILADEATEDRPDERLRAIRAIAREIFDDRGAARAALGPQWDARTPAERDEFAGLFANLFERSFLVGFVSRVRAGGAIEVTYLSESVDGAAATVQTAVNARNGQDLTIDYQMIARGSRWLVRDVVMDGVSLTANYRAQFARVMRVSSYEDLVAQMRDKTQDVSPVAATGPSATTARPVAEPAADPTTAPAPMTPIPDAAAPDTPPPTAVAAPPAEPSAARLRQTAIGSSQAPKARGYWVQVGAFKSHAAAQRLKSTLSQRPPTRGPDARIVVEPPPPGSSLTRVRIGPFRDQGRALSAVQELEARGYRPFIAAVR